MYMKIHELKCWQVYYEALENGSKTFEYRKNDRNFQVGDMLSITLFDPAKNTLFKNHILYFIITYILQGVMNLPNGYCILGIKSSQIQIKKDQYDYRFDHKDDTLEDDLQRDNYGSR